MGCRWVTEQLGTAHPKLTKAERRHDACYRCGSESGERKGKGEKKGSELSYARKSKQGVTEQISVVRDVGTYGKVKGQPCGRCPRAAGWRVNAKVKFWLSHLLS